MASNSNTHSVSYTPRYTQEEAFDLFPLELRTFYQNLAVEFDTESILRFYRKNGLEKTKKWLLEGERLTFEKGFQPRTRSIKHKIDSTAVVLNIPPLRAA